MKNTFRDLWAAMVNREYIEKPVFICNYYEPITQIPRLLISAPDGSFQIVEYSSTNFIITFLKLGIEYHIWLNVTDIPFVSFEEFEIEKSTEENSDTQEFARKYIKRHDLAENVEIPDEIVDELVKIFDDTVIIPKEKRNN